MSAPKATAGVSAALAALALTPLASATQGTLEFEDLTPGTSYSEGESFVTEGVQVDVVEFFYSGGGQASGGAAYVNNPTEAGAGTGVCPANVSLLFNFDYPATIIGFAYAEFGGNVNLTINGILLNDDDLLDFDGMVVDGVTVDVNDNGDNTGFVNLIGGSITEFCVGGQEFCIDDVRCVPTPGALSALALAGLAATRRRRR